MVAPTRAPQTRGVKCDLCKKILSLATWLDQTKLAKSIKEASTVLDLIKQHNTTCCLCMPKNIENLLVGSTYFELHRIIADDLDTSIHKSQQKYFIELRRSGSTGLKKPNHQTINDCNDPRTISRFKLYLEYEGQNYDEAHLLQLKYLTHSIDYWKMAMEDKASPFNSKLALRLGLTHHVIYACYLFKFHKILDYQLISANLVLNLFKSVEGVTANAIMHAHFLLIRSLIECDQISQAKHSLKMATKVSNYEDKSYYESILVTCIGCELSLLDKNDTSIALDDLNTLSVIQKDDKLQHYYARTLAASTIIKYIHCHPARSELCFEFFHTFRYIGAIIRRCFESVFDLVIWEKDIKDLNSTTNLQVNSMLSHSWIRFALCDFVFSTFDLLTSFFARTGMPECLELLFNGLSLIANRTGSSYWRAKIASIGASLDIICDNYDYATAKLNAISHVSNNSNHSYLINLLRLELEVRQVSLLERKGTVIKEEVTLDLIQRLKLCYSSLMERITQIELYECTSNTYVKLTNHFSIDDNLLVTRNSLGHLSFQALKLTVSSMLRNGNYVSAKSLINNLGLQLKEMKNEAIVYNDFQTILETLLSFSEIDKSGTILLESAKSSDIFFQTETNSLSSVESQMSFLTLSSEPTEDETSLIFRKSAGSKSSTCRRSRRKAVYRVTEVSGESYKKTKSARTFCLLDALENFSTLTKKEIVLLFLKQSEPNPDYLLYRKAHELLCSYSMENSKLDRKELLFHFCESSTSNTMRYRWMMYEEQKISPYEPCKATQHLIQHNIKHLGFSNILSDVKRSVKSLLKALPENQRLVQFKYIIDRKLLKENLLCASFTRKEDPIFVNAYRSIPSDDSLKAKRSNFEERLLPQQFETKIAEAKKTLFYTDYRMRSEARLKLDKEMGVFLQNLENKWLGPFRFLLCGPVIDESYNQFICEVSKELLDLMGVENCSSRLVLHLMLENAPILSRQEFCHIISIIFNCAVSSDKSRECFNIWLKLMEVLVNKKGPSSSKMFFFQSLEREQLGLVLDKGLEFLPIESLPIVRITKQGIFRVPSLRLYNIIVNRHCCTLNRELNINETVYILDPASNLEKTRERFETKLRAKREWLGTISRAPELNLLEEWFKTKEIYIFIGHGAGTSYYKGLCKGKGLSAMSNIKPLPIVMGCSSGRLMAEGPQLESFGISWVFILKGSSSYVGLLWDVTDTDIDKFLDTLLSKWMGCKWDTSNSNSKGDTHLAITDAISQARQICRSKFLVGATPVLYGLPVKCKPVLH